MNLIFFLSSFFSYPFFIFQNLSFASTLPSFNAEESSGSAIIRGNQTGDLDAKNLYDILTAPIEIVQGFNFKQSLFPDLGIELSCMMSPRYTETGTCRVKLSENSFNKIDFQNKSFESLLNGEHCKTLISAFKTENNSENVYASANKRFQVYWNKEKQLCRISFR